MIVAASEASSLQQLAFCEPYVHCTYGSHEQDSIAERDSVAGTAQRATRWWGRAT